MQKKLITVNSLSGGKTSSYMAKHYPSDYNVFSLVRTNDTSCKFPDAKIRQIVSDRIGCEFVGTLEMDEIIYTMLDLEQFIGSKITWVTGKTFDQLIVDKAEYLPNKVARYCTTELKTVPIIHWMYDVLNEPVEMRFGYRANEVNRANNMLSKVNDSGFTEVKVTFEKHPNGQNKWVVVPYCKPKFPLIDDQIFKDNVHNFWEKNKSVRFAYMNNCVGCWWRSELLLKHMFDKEPTKMEWFAKQERIRKGSFKTNIKYDKIKAFKTQHRLFDDDFNECDSGNCGL